MTRNALITGASRGLGAALAHSLSADGWTLVVDARGGDDLARATAGVPGVVAVPGDVAKEAHRLALRDAVAAAGGLDLLVHNASVLGPSPQPPLDDYPIDVFEHVLRVNLTAPLRLTQLLAPLLRPGAAVVAITSDAAVEPYEGWGGYGASKAALEQLFAIYGAEHPELRVYVADPGDMNTRMHQEAFPGEDISDRPPPQASVPGLRALVDGTLPSGRYRARELAPVRG